MKITFLGTGAGIPSKERNVSAIVLDLLQEINEIWLFDCGEATQHQLLHTTIKPRKIKKIFITHLHGDHIFGLPGLLSSRSFQGGDDPLTIYGPKGIKEYVITSLKVSSTRLAYPLHFSEFSAAGDLFSTDKFDVTTTRLHHGIKSFGYKVKELDQPGRLKVEELKEMGIKPGPIYQQIKANDKTILEDGRMIFRDDILGEDKKGRMICILGDTTFLPELASFIRNSNVLIHEATYLHALKDLARNHFHSTAYEAATLAKKGDVDTLILTHVSSRYQNEQMTKLLEEAQTVFKNTHLAHDFYSFELK